MVVSYEEKDVKEKSHHVFVVVFFGRRTCPKSWDPREGIGSATPSKKNVLLFQVICGERVFNCHQFMLAARHVLS